MNKVNKFRVYLPVIVTAVMGVMYAINIWHTAVEPIFDQKKLIDYTFSFTNYPTYETGLSSRLIIGIYNQLDVFEPVSSNAHIRTIAMILYVAAGYLLFSVDRKKTAVTLLCLLLLLTSRYPFLWLSSELFAGAFLMLVLWSVGRKLPFGVTVAFVVLFALSKPDLIFSGTAVALYLVFAFGPDCRARWKNISFIIGWMLLLLLPGVVQEGTDYVKPQGRALFSFRQHYSALVQNHQMTTERPNPWLDWQPYFYPVWGESESLVELITTNPHLYMDFIFLSISHSLRSFLLSNLLFLIPVWAYALYKIQDRKLKTISLLFLSGLIPITLLSFTHVRYIARFYPLLLWGIYLFLLRSEERLANRVIVSYLLILLGLQIYQTGIVFSSAHWFPD